MTITAHVHPIDPKRVAHARSRLPNADDAARHFDHGLRAGGALVTVDAGPRTGEALAIMQRHEVDLGPAGVAGYNLGNRYVLDSSTPGAMTERRRVADPSYSGPERRLIGV